MTVKFQEAAVRDLRVAALLRWNLYCFAIAAFEVLNPGTPFLPALYLELIAAQLDACRQGDIRRLVINLPPRYGKSHFASVVLPAFLLGHDPTVRILCISYGLDLAEKLQSDFLTLIESELYRAVFGAHDARTQNAREFVTAAGGRRVAASFGGALTGRGFNVIIIDDPLKAGDARSRKKRQKVNDFYQNTVLSRLDDKATGRIIIAMQRLHARDLVGHVLEQEGEDWHVLSVPAIADKQQMFTFETTMGVERRFVRERGTALHPARDSLDQLKKTRLTMGHEFFAAQYQQKPGPAVEALIKAEWLQYYRPGELPQRFDVIVQSWDTASKNAEMNDYSVCTTWGAKDGEYFLIDLLRKKLIYPELKRMVHEQRARHKPQVILIEDQGSGTSLIQDLRHEGLAEVQGCKTPRDKRTRLMAQTPAIEAGRLHLPAKAPWRSNFIDEFTSFPDTEHDDQVDSASQALEWFKRSSRSTDPPIIAALRRQVAPPAPGLVRMKPSPGVNCWQPPNRAACMVEQDGTLDVEEQWVGGLLQCGWTKV